MVHLIVGKKGKGKTKQLLDKVNAEIKKVEGSIVYLDKSTKHVFELNNKVRLINVTDYMMSEAFHVDFVLSVSMDEHELPEALKKNILVAL